MVFRDVEGIRKGDDFPKKIRKEVRRSRVLVVAIGPGWLDAVDADGELRLPQEHDWVRQEIELGLTSRRVRAVIPVLLNGATIPKAEQLPPSIRPLVTRNGLVLSSADIDKGADELVEAIEDWGVPRQEDLSRSKLVVAAVVAVAALAVVGFGLTRVDRSDPSAPEVAAPATPTAAADGAAGPATPTLMEGDFNVAVADFSAADPDDEARAGVLAARLAKRLSDELPSQTDVEVEVRGPDEVGAIVGDTPEARRRAAAQIAEQIDADVVLGGQVSFAGPSTIVPTAFLNPKRLFDHPELGGLYELDPIAARGSYANPITKDNLLAGLARTTEAMGSFIGGVSYYAVVDDDPSYPALAEQRFRSALESPVLPASAEEGAHAFLGSLGLIRRDLDQAQAEFTAASVVNDRSVRARLGLAEVRYLRSTGVRCAAGTADLGGLRDASAAFDAVAGEELDRGSEVKARLGAARAKGCQAQAGGAVDRAGVARSLRAVLTLAGDDEATRELAAAAHAELALAVAPAAGSPDTEAAAEALAETERAVALSLRPADKAVYLWQQAFFEVQLGEVEAARRTLADAAEADASFRAVTVDMLVPQSSGRAVPSGVGAPPNARTSTPLAVTGGREGDLAVVGAALLLLGAALRALGRRRGIAA